MNIQRPLRHLPATGLNSRCLSKLHPLLWLACVLGLGGCRMARPLPPANLAEPGWTLREGQVVWRRKTTDPEIAGELLVATQRNGETFLQFSKTPLPFVVARLTTNRWYIEFVTVQRKFSGHGQPPSWFGWLHLAGCVAGRSPPATWHWKKLADDRWRLENRASGERFEGFLKP